MCVIGRNLVQSRTTRCVTEGWSRHCGLVGIRINQSHFRWLSWCRQLPYRNLSASHRLHLEILYGDRRYSFSAWLVIRQHNDTDGTNGLDCQSTTNVSNPWYFPRMIWFEKDVNAIFIPRLWKAWASDLNSTEKAWRVTVTPFPRISVHRVHSKPQRSCQLVPRFGTRTQ
jgi:hypothetical protein